MAEEAWEEKGMVHNKVILIGRMAKDAIIVPPRSEDQKPIAHFTLAVERYGGKDNADGNTDDFFRCNAYRQRAEFLEKYGKKGVKFAVEGHLVSGGYEKDGVRIPTVEIDVESIEFCEKKDAGAAGEPDIGEKSGGQFMDVPDGLMEELPFK